jgi:hypothetical protein
MPIIALENLQQFAAVKIGLDQGEIGGPLIIPSCYQVTLNWTLAGGKIGHNVLYGRYSGSANPTVALANSLFGALSTGAPATSLMVQMAPSTIFTGLTLRDVNVQDQPLVQSTGSAVSGTAASGALPNEMAICITTRTAKTGRANRGRIYLPGFSTLAVVGGSNIILAATKTAVDNWAATLIGAFSGQSLVLVIGQPARAAYTGSTGALHPARVAGSTPITSAATRDDHWDSQRRRGLR